MSLLIAVCKQLIGSVGGKPVTGDTWQWNDGEQIQWNDGEPMEIN